MHLQNKHNRLLWKEAQYIRRRHPERSRCRMCDDTTFTDTTEWTLIQSLETSRTMFIAVFNAARDICMINSIHRKHKYHQILQRHALTPRKRLCERWFIKNILTCVI